MHYLLTGATGFIGSAIAEFIVKEGHQLTILTRRPYPNLHSKNINQIICDLEDYDSLSLEKFVSIDCVIHAAARAHIMSETSDNTLIEYRKSNRDATLNLAKFSLQNGIKRFIYLSSVKVNGEQTMPGYVFKSDDSFITNDPYGLSKYEAEIGILKLAAESRMDVIIIRPPLVYGPGVKANFASMVNWVRKGVPLPFGMVDNKRSLIAIDNLVDFIILCSDRAKSPKAANQIFLISDGEHISTTTLLRKVAKAYGARSLLLPIPVSLMRLVAKLLGKSDMANRLFGNLQVDSTKASELLGWKPVITMDEQLRKMAEYDKARD